MSDARATFLNPDPGQGIGEMLALGDGGRAAKIAVALIAVVAVAAGIAAVMLIPGGEGPSRQSLSVYHYWTSGTDKDAIDALKQAFGENREIDLKFSGYTGYQDKLSMVIDSSPPDVAAHWFNKYYRDYARRGSLLDLTGFWENSGLSQVYPQKIQNLIKVDGKMYGVPLDIHWEGGVVLYNLRVLNRYGISVPETWDGFQLMLSELKSRGVEHPIAMGFADAWPRDMVFTAILAAVGGSDFYQDLASGNARWTDNKVAEAFEVYRDWCREGYFDPSAPGLDWQQALNTFINGETAVYFMGDWACAALKKVGWQPNVDYRADFIPALPGVTPIAIPDLEGFVIPAKAANKELAMEFLEFISDPETQITFASIKGSTAPHPNADIQQYGDDIQRAMWNEAENRDWALPIMWYFSQAVRDRFGDAMYRIWEKPSEVNISEICASIDEVARG